MQQQQNKSKKIVFCLHQASDNTLDPVRKNGFIDRISPIDGRLTAIATAPCMSTITTNSLLHQSTQLIAHPKLSSYHSHSNSVAATYDTHKTLLSSTAASSATAELPTPPALHGSVPPNGIHGHSNPISASNCHHPSVNQSKAALTMSQLSTVYATKRRRRNGKR